MRNVVFKALPYTAQSLAIDSRANDTLIHGTRGGMKTATQLMRFKRLVGLGYGKFWRGIICDREFKDLADLVAQSDRFFHSFNDGAKFLSSASEYKWKWPTGEELLFRHLKKSEDYNGFHGHEYPFIGWNELTKYPTAELFLKMLSTNRSSFTPELHTPKRRDGSYRTYNGLPLPRIPLQTFSTTNPSGAGHVWVKRKFITPAPNGHIVRKEVEVFNPQTKEYENFIRTQVAIFASYMENPYLDAQYIANLHEITDENLKKAWLTGSWDIVSGGAFEDVWRIDRHRIPRFKIPSNWHVDRSLDWGSSHPFSVGWWAEANGEEVKLEDGSTFCPPPGTLIRIAELYGTKEIGTNIGVKWGSKRLAQEIKQKEIQLMQNDWIKSQPWPGPADNQIANVVDSGTDTIEKQMSDEGIRWTKSDKSKGTRKIGLQLMRDRMQASIDMEGAGLYVMANCEAFLETVPNLPRDPDDLDDIDKTAEDHPYDESRYRILASNNRTSRELNLQIPH